MYVEELVIEMPCETAVLNIILGKNMRFVIGIYRTQGNLKVGLQVIIEVLGKMSAEKYPTILIGDINIDCLDRRNISLQLRDAPSSNNMHRVDLPPARLIPTSQTSIGCVFTNLLT